MTRPLIVLRPEPGLAQTIAAARECGLSPVAAPLFAIAPAAWQAPDPADFDAILAGSANAFRLGGPALAGLTALPVHAVGKRTADAARAAGFTVARVGAGGLQSVLDGVPPGARILRLAGETRVMLEVPAGVLLTERVVYRTLPLALPDPAVAALRGGAVALIHSAAAAAHFAEECDRLSIDRSQVTIAALGARIAAAAGPGWRAVASAERPADDRLLALARRLCQ